ncbi:MAG: FIST C-terminal domain-containing protein [Burkholderiales bacterium]|nr:FIST C-terminal domain-containing protein [Burkholderiales bacterium]
MFRLGHAAGGAWREAVDACLVQLGSGAGATLGFVYMSDRLAGEAAAILERLQRETGVRDWVGTVGLGVIATGTEYFDEPALAVLLADFPPGEFSVFSGRSRPPPPGSRTPSGADAAHFAVVHGDPYTEDIPALVEDMSHKVASGFLVGGLASSRTVMFQVANGLLRGGLSGVVLSSGIPVAIRVSQGCAPLAARHRITRAEGNVIVTLDGRPALDVFREDVGEVLARDLARAARYIHAALPVAGSDTGDYLVRNLVGFDARQRLLAIGAEVEPGMPLMFCRRDGAAARDDLERTLDSLAGEFRGPPRGALYFSCVGRGENLFGERSVELGIIRDRLGDLPLAGFFCNGEISHDRLYGYTGVLTVFL